MPLSIKDSRDIKLIKVMYWGFLYCYFYDIQLFSLAYYIQEKDTAAC